MALSQKQLNALKLRWPQRTREERFWEKVEKTEGCWNWLANKDNNGYGRFDGKLAHRISWQFAGRSLTPGKEICHDCNNSSCVNPDHLFEGTHKENMEHASQSNLMTGPRKFTDKQYDLLCAMNSAGISQKEIAEKLGMSPSFVSSFLKGRYVHAKPF